MEQKGLSEETYRDFVNIFAFKSGRTVQELEETMAKALKDIWEMEEVFHLLFPNLDRPPTLREVMPLLIWIMGERK